MIIYIYGKFNDYRLYATKESSKYANLNVIKN